MFNVIIKFDPFQNLLTITAYLGCVANLDLSLLECVKVKVSWIVYRFSVAEGELRRPRVAEGRCEFLCCGSRQRRNDTVAFFSRCVSYDHR